jgi:hypothetical protein
LIGVGLKSEPPSWSTTQARLPPGGENPSRRDKFETRLKATKARRLHKIQPIIVVEILWYL